MKPGIPQGTRDFSAEVVRKRQYIFQTIRNVFELYGYEPLETPAMENLETLMGKYGEEGDKLIFRILDSGNPFSKDFVEELIKLFKQLQEYFKHSYETIEFLKENEKEFAKSENPFSNSMWNLNPDVLAKIFETFIKEDEVAYKNLLLTRSEISGKALRYDLTIPFARYVAMNHGKLSFPFKRYQMQPVWRADRPQKGRYREFYQCDADVVGSYSLINEVELANIYAEVFRRLGVAVEIKLNSRKILTALAEVCGGADKMIDITIAIDKLDKIGLDKVKEELTQRGLNEWQVKIIEDYLSISGTNTEKLTHITNLLGHTEAGKKGIEELSFVIAYCQPSTVNCQLDFTLARGLNYYTGVIYEAKALNAQMGSIGGGGRYDDLTGLFGVPNVPGVGISFGVDRIYDVMEELKLFPADVHTGTQVLFFNLGDAESKKSFELMQQLRSKGIRCELYHENAKFDKQFKYAEKKNIPYAVIIGTKELESSTCNVKNLVKAEQVTINFDELLSFKF
ncbi:MAG: histidine--tRNA ligase [Sphingobacteriales bacterium]|nr:MAG: histidine--tRNA ligase [Sphingobacteriales bacterium]